MTNSNRLSHRFSHSSPTEASTQKLEQLWNLPSTIRTKNRYFVTSQSSSLLKRLCQSLVAFLTGEQTIRIWTSYSSEGVVWHVYDPVGDRYSSHSSESALRTWLESSHLH